MKEKSAVATVVDAEAMKALEQREKALVKAATAAVPACKTQADADAVAAKLHEIKDYRAAVDSVFADILASAKATVKAVNKQVKRFTDPADNWEEALRSSLNAWNTKKLIAEEKKAERQSAHTGTDVAPQRVTTSEDTSIRKVWYAEVTDVALLPDDYWIVDEARLQREASALKEPFSVPGAVAKFRASSVIR